MAKILVVEDDLPLSTGLCFELDTSGYLTVAAYNCQKALKLIKIDHFDLAILDINLPDGDGFELCREIKKEQPQLPVLFLTAKDLEQDVLKGFDLGALWNVYPYQRIFGENIGIPVYKTTYPQGNILCKGVDSIVRRSDCQHILYSSIGVVPLPVPAWF